MRLLLLVVGWTLLLWGGGVYLSMGLLCVLWAERRMPISFRRIR